MSTSLYPIASFSTHRDDNAVLPSSPGAVVGQTFRSRRFSSYMPVALPTWPAQIDTPSTQSPGAPIEQFKEASADPSTEDKKKKKAEGGVACSSVVLHAYCEFEGRRRLNGSAGPAGVAGRSVASISNW